MNEARSPAFRHTPYAGPHRSFSIGLSPIEADDWIEVDARLAEQLDLKERILADEGAAAFAALAGTEAAQAEVRDAVAAHLTARFPAIHQREGGSIHIVPAGRRIVLDEGPPLRTASRLAQEDLLLMRRDDEGWRLVAGSLCFPSSWSLSEKMGRPLAAIHSPVPGFEGQMATRVARIFDHLRADAPVERFNLSIYGDGRLRHPETRQEPHERFPPEASILERAHVRVERQTLRRMARSGAILFTVRVHVDPLADLGHQPRGPALAAALYDHVAALSPDELAYKGLVESREGVLAAIAGLAASNPAKA